MLTWTKDHAGQSPAPQHHAFETMRFPERVSTSSLPRPSAPGTMIYWTCAGKPWAPTWPIPTNSSITSGFLSRCPIDSSHNTRRNQGLPESQAARVSAGSLPIKSPRAMEPMADIPPAEVEAEYHWHKSNQAQASCFSHTVSGKPRRFRHPRSQSRQALEEAELHEWVHKGLSRFSFATALGCEAHSVESLIAFSNPPTMALATAIERQPA
jgi:hypothetical protein